MRTSGMRFQPSARIEPPLPAPIRAAVSREVRKPVSKPRLDDSRSLGRDALVVEREAAEPARRSSGRR